MARRAPPHPGAYDRTMALASTGSDLVTAVCMTVVIGMAGLLVFRATRTRSEDRDEE